MGVIRVKGSRAEGQGGVWTREHGLSAWARCGVWLGVGVGSRWGGRCGVWVGSGGIGGVVGVGCG